MPKMTTQTAPPEQVSAAQIEAIPAPKRATYTRWDAFQKCNLVVTEIVCAGYKEGGFHPSDLSCHTRLPIRAQSVIDHYFSEHGGGFTFKVKVGDSPSPIWQELMDAGVELEDFRCAECLQPVRITPIDIKHHMSPHLCDKRMKSSEKFLLTVSMKQSIHASREEFEAEE